MQKMRLNSMKLFSIWLTGFFLLLAATRVIAEEQTATLNLPNPSDPAIAVFMEWNTALINNNFFLYKKLSFTPPPMTDEMLLQLFELQKKNVPSIFKITGQTINPNGSVSFHAVGCKDNHRLINVVVVGNQNGSWQVVASGWGAPWNATVNLCPV